MRCGLFGKVPSKRDFVAVAAPRAFLRVFEPWLETGLKQGRACGDDWTQAFHTAPIWRFWLGPALCGEAFTGAFMPSVDALGRMFPLTVVGSSCDGPLAPPEIDSRSRWFTQVEDLLLDALDPNASFETLVARLGGLSDDAPTAEPDALAKRFAAIRAQQANCPLETATFWWTIGGGDCPQCAMAQKGMPSPELFADMLRRRNRPDESENENRASDHPVGADP